MLAPFTFLLFTASFFIHLKDTNALFCFSCNSTSEPCLATYCSTAPNVSGYCAFQRVYDSYGTIQRQIQTCLPQNFMRAGNHLIKTVGRCVKSVTDGQRYETYICNDTNLCNMDSQCTSQPQTPVPPTLVPPTKSLECFKCDEEAENCQSASCTTTPNGYCLYQKLQTVGGGGVEFRSIKSCLPRPYAVAPNGEVITTVNRCIHSYDAQGNLCDTLICNSSNFCNDECIPYIEPATIPTITTTTKSAGSVKWWPLLMIIPVVMSVSM